MADITMKRGDTYPNLVLALHDDNGPINLSGATQVRLLLKNATPPNQAITLGPLSVTGATTGEVTYVWELDDLLDVGVYQGEVEVTWSAGKYQTLPHDTYFTLQVVADLGGAH